MGSSTVEAAWSRCGDQDCIRLSGLFPDSTVQVHPATAAMIDAAPPMAGRLVRDGNDVCFIPRFPFVDGTAYTVTVDGVATVDLVRPRPERAATTEVLAIHPTARVVPRNLLRFYVWFTAPMSEGYVARHIRLIDDAGETMAGALLPTENELWDPTRRRLTVLLDPARIKRGLLAHRQAGYPLRSGTSFRVVVDAGFRDATGGPLRFTTERRYHVDGDERRRVEPDDWALAAPPCGTNQHLQIAFDRPLDHGLMTHCLHVTGPDGHPIEGTIEVGPEELWWRLKPRRPWIDGPHRIIVDPILEDVAGNSISRVFDRDLTRAEDRPGDAEPVTLWFQPRGRNLES